MTEQHKTPLSRETVLTGSIVFGIALGSLLGMVLLDSIGIGVGLGLSFGLALGAIIESLRKRGREEWNRGSG